MYAYIFISYPSRACIITYNLSDDIVRSNATFSCLISKIIFTIFLCLYLTVKCNYYLWYTYTVDIK